MITPNNPNKIYKKGDKIALSNNTGTWTTGSHLHEGVLVEYYENGAWRRDTNNGYLGAIDHFDLLEKPNMPSIIDKIENDKAKQEALEKFRADFKKKYDTKWIRNSNTGEFAYYVGGVLRTFNQPKERITLALIDTIFRNFKGVTINQPDWDKLLKEKF